MDVAFRVIADHIRTLSFAIADGIQPGNTDRNYVLRRILRRAVRYGRTLGFHEPFFYKLVAVLARTMGDVFPENRAQAEASRGSDPSGRKRRLTRRWIRESRYSKPKSRSQSHGVGHFGRVRLSTLRHHGFPLDLTELMARERGLTVDTAGFETLMEEQRARARAAQKKSHRTFRDRTTGRRRSSSATTRSHRRNVRKCSRRR